MTDFSSVREHLKSGKQNLPELVDEFLARIKERNSEINAFVSVDEKEAREEARAIQKRIDDGSAGRLAGAVIGIKDIICQKGKPATCASGILKDFESVYDATVIEKLRSEDALLIGRLNMDEFAMGSSNENSIYGPVRNPHNPDKVPGGSSGGSAAAVAADMCHLTLGTDTGGSIRQPASYCGVVGLKPTYGRVSRHGLIAFASSFDCIGPLSGSVRDSAELLSVLAGQDAMDSTTSDREVSDYTAALDEDRVLTVGVPEEYFSEGLSEEVKERVEEVLQSLESNGQVRLKPVHLPHMKYGIATYYILATAEASSNLARYDGIRYGHRADIRQVHQELAQERDEVEAELRSATNGRSEHLEEALQKMDTTLIRLYKNSRTEGFGREVKRRILLGTYVLSAGYYDAYYSKAQKVRRLIKQDFDQVFSEVDVIVSPTAPTTAFDLGAKMDDPMQMYLNDIYTTSANLAGICGISVPAGTDRDGLPIGIQFMGGKFQEATILKAASLVETLYG